MSDISSADTIFTRRKVMSLAHINSIKAEELEMYIHRTAERRAKTINKAGLECQIDYLVDELGPQETRDIIETIVDLRTGYPYDGD